MFNNCSLFFKKGVEKMKKWQDLPNYYQDKKEIETFYKDLNLTDVVEYMRLVIVECRKYWEDKDRGVFYKEWLLIKEFEKKATPEDIDNFQELLEDFEVVDSKKAVNISCKLQGKSKKYF
jgi:hypothetical protein